MKKVNENDSHICSSSSSLDLEKDRESENHDETVCHEDHEE
jgi:hypothetical protein